MRATQPPAARQFAVRVIRRLSAPAVVLGAVVFVPDFGDPETNSRHALEAVQRIHKNNTILY